MESKSEYVMLDKKTIRDWFKNEGLSVGMRRISVSLTHDDLIIKSKIYH